MEVWGSLTYWAANIRCMAFWTHPHLQSKGPDWTLSELNSCKGVSLEALLGSSLDDLSQKPSDNPVNLQFKIVHRAHMSKTKLSSFYPSLSPICDKCKTNDGTLFHIYWLCPTIQIFWNNVFNALSKILGRDFVPSPTNIGQGFRP